MTTIFAAAAVSGLEFYVGIPGSVGGAVRMNAGGHGSDVGMKRRGRFGGLCRETRVRVGFRERKIAEDEP